MGAPKTRLDESLDDLRLALDHYESLDSSATAEKKLAFLSLSKAFEVAVEYAWKELKVRATDEGLDPQSPKAAIRDAARIGLVDDPNSWILYVNTRNAGVHDYFALPAKEYLEIAHSFVAAAQKLR